MLLTLNEMSQAPIVGLYNSEIIEIANKIAESYNNSVKNVNLNNFLGYNFKMIPELKGCKASYDFEDRILEIHYNKYTSFILPSSFSDFSHLNKYFDLKETKGFKSEILIESFDKRTKIYETISLKGKATKALQKVSGTAKKVKEKFFDKEIQIESTDSLEQLSNTIVKNVKNILGNTPDSAKLYKLIESGVTRPSETPIQDIYDLIAASNIQSKYAEVYRVKFKKFFDEIEKDGDYPGKTLEKDVIAMVAECYEVSSKTILAFNGHAKYKKRAATAIKYGRKIKNGLNSLVNWIKPTIQGIMLGTIAWNGFFTGLTVLLKKTLSICLKFLKWLVTIDSVKNDKNFGKIKTEELESLKEKIGKAVDNPGEFIDAVSNYMKSLLETASEKMKDMFITVWNKSASVALEFLDYIQGEFFDVLGLGTAVIDKTMAGKYITGIATAIIGIYFYENSMRLYKNINTAFSNEEISNNELYVTFSYEKLINNNGFDKYITTLGITFILLDAIGKAIKNNKFNKEETAHLKKLFSAVKKVQKTRTKQGIKYLTDEASLKSLGR